MFEIFTEEVLKGEGFAGVALIDCSGLTLAVHTDHWNRYYSNILNSDENIYELKESLEATGFLVVVADVVYQPVVRGFNLQRR